MTRQSSSINRTRITRLIAAVAIGSLAASVMAASGAAATESTPRHPAAKIDAGKYGFDRPYAIAAAAGHLWITNLAGNSVTETNSHGGWVRTLADSGYGFNKPDAITAANGRLFVVNRHRSVTVINPHNGALIRVVKGSRYAFRRPTAVLVHAGMVWVVNSAGDSLTEFRAADGSLVRVVRASSSRGAWLDDPNAVTAAGDDLWVVNGKGGSTSDASAGSVTEIDATTGGFVRHLHGASFGLDAPKGIGFDGTHLWVSDSTTDAVTELDTSGQLVQAITNSSNNSNYGFDGPTVVVAKAGMVYVVSPLSDSPMVTQIQPATAAGNWFECNTNSPSPEWFNPTGLAVQGGNIWVVSPGKNPTAGGPSNALVELEPSDGKAIKRIG